MAVEDDDQGKVPGPTISPFVLFKFIAASAMMVLTPAALFFLSMHGYFDSVLSSQAHAPVHTLRSPAEFKRCKCRLVWLSLIHI